MPSFGTESKTNLATCRKELQDIANEAIQYVDFRVACGHRNEKDQNDAFSRGASQVKWPDGKHNKLPSEAMDVLPPPYDYKDAPAAYILAGVLLAVAKRQGTKIRLGADWDGDMNTLEHSLKDPWHIELA